MAQVSQELLAVQRSVNCSVLGFRKTMLHEHGDVKFVNDDGFWQFPLLSCVGAVDVGPSPSRLCTAPGTDRSDSLGVTGSAKMSRLDHPPGPLDYFLGPLNLLGIDLDGIDHDFRRFCLGKHGKGWCPGAGPELWLEKLGACDRLAGGQNRWARACGLQGIVYTGMDQLTCELRELGVDPGAF
jgi:hypothetical protein